jgi:hypothetical protein
MLKICFAFIAVLVLSFLLTEHAHLQEKMTVKPRDFNPQKSIFVIPERMLMQIPKQSRNEFGTGQNDNNKDKGPHDKDRTGFSYSFTNNSVTTVYPNIRIFTSPYNQTTPLATLSPTDPNRIFAGANTDYGMGYYYTLNAGVNWAGGDILPGSVYYSTNPACVYGGSGAIHYNYIENIIVADKSTNNGANWTGRVAVPSGAQFDMNNMSADQNLLSPFYGRIYIVWSNFDVSQPYIVLSYSVNAGASFSAPQQIGLPPAGHYEQGARIAVASNGDVYCVWATPNISNNNIEDKIGFTKSTNGGINWSAPATPITISGIRGFVLPSNVRVNSFPSIAIDKSGGARNGYIYICWAQKNLAPAGSDADICLAYSSNSGTSWSTAVRVNNDALNNGKLQFLPWITVDQSNGKIAIVFYDNRDAVIPDSCNTYVAVSADGGASFINMRVSDRSQKIVPLPGYADGYFSDYISVVANNDRVFPFWADNRNANVQIYTANVFLSPYITHTPLKDNENLAGPYSVNAEIQGIGSGINSAETKVVWGRGGLTDSVAMTQSGGNNWSANIPGNGTPAQYRYYIKTKDNNGKESRLPVNSPSAYFSFLTGADTSKPVISHTPDYYPTYRLWPDTLLVSVTDNKGLDSVWVRWYRNNTSTGIKHFRLNNVQDDFYKGNFNSTQQQVEPNDSVYYKIFASDNSSNHNTDSTVLYKIKLNSYYNTFVGNGTISTPYPYRTFYTDSRTELLYTAAELTANGGTGPSRVMAIGFNILNASPITMTGFTVKIQNTTNANLTGFTTGGWTTFFSGSYQVPNTSWQSIGQQTPFLWDGTSNLLVEVCYNNNGFNTNSAVAASTAPGKTWHQYQDLPAGNGCTDLTAGSSQNNRPNIVFTLNSIIGVEENLSGIPAQYSLDQNFPNPFNPVTKILYEVPQKGLVTVKIFDLLGREIRALVNDVKNPGKYTIDFNGADLSSGVYFCVMKSGDFAQTRRMILIK